MHSSSVALHDLSAPSLFCNMGNAADATHHAGDRQSESEGVEVGPEFLTKDLESLHLTDRFIGQSSGVKLINQVQEMKPPHVEVNHGKRPPGLSHMRSRFWRIKPVRHFFQAFGIHLKTSRIITVGAICTSSRETRLLLPRTGLARHTGRSLLRQIQCISSPPPPPNI